MPDSSSTSSGRSATPPTSDDSSKRATSGRNTLVRSTNKPQKTHPKVIRPTIPLPPSQQQDTVPVPSRSRYARPNSPPHHLNTDRRQTFNLYAGPPPDTLSPTLKIRVIRIPHGWTTFDAYQLFTQYGNVSKIEMVQYKSEAYVTFRPPPIHWEWTDWPLYVDTSNGLRHKLHLVRLPSPDLVELPSKPGALPQTLPESFQMPATELNIGVMATDTTMLIPFSEVASNVSPLSLRVDVKYRKLEFYFSANISDNDRKRHNYKVATDLAQIGNVHQTINAECRPVLIFELVMPPLVYRKVDNIRETHDDSASSWNESQMWLRQTCVVREPRSDVAPTTLQNLDAVVDVARWLTYRLVLTDPADSSSGFIWLGQLLNLTNVKIFANHAVHTRPTNVSSLWAWSAASSQLTLSPQTTVHDLAFEVRYQLEACLSGGIFHECNIEAEFLAKLAGIEVPRATKLLEKAMDEKRRFYHPMEILKLLPQVSVVEKKRPSYCAKIRSAVVTPTSIYIATPVMETTNRIVRKYAQHIDRFLRVKFIDERYRGGIRTTRDSSSEEVFARVKRTMQSGIEIAGRHYDFLAFGNSQFREHGAYFFASTHNLTADDIRKDMGSFSHITNVAKYASRLGQCFSTTRGLSFGVRVEGIEDVVRNGYTFTDGVGKISPFLAQMIAQMYSVPDPFNNYPSVVQFRLGGYKGVLAVDPALNSQTIQTRPSQQKFPAAYHGLEVCRLSQFTAANLNQQIILVLSARGVSDEIFLRKMRDALQDIEEAMAVPDRAKEELCKKIDFNQNTLILAQMVEDGFMATKDPFTISCLRLWRSWMVKYLKEKAHIFIDEGAFVLGCTDETATLRGDFTSDKHDNTTITNTTPLPEIFLQIPDSKRPGSYVVVEGVCIIARNPSLHPGDIRVVRAVDVPALRHLKNCVVLPQTGDRDLANMCSGGDLDGDDYLIIWDKDLIPPEWYHEPMHYQAPQPVKAKLPISVDAVTSFFVMHMKHNNLGLIATAHRYAADSSFSEGVKDPRCLQLAQLHSMAVDFAKTGTPAVMPKELYTKSWPHWAEKAGKKTYHSKRILGQLYDAVQRKDFIPAWHLPFSRSILEAHQVDENMLTAAAEIKADYDDAVRRIMVQHGIKSEFEVWTSFILNHNQEENDYKLAERLGETVSTLKEHFREVCFERAGTTRSQREWPKLAPFLVAMYTVTAEEMSQAVEKTRQTKRQNGQDVPIIMPSAETMPFMSFPWIFAQELGYIAGGRAPGQASCVGAVTTLPSKKPMAKMVRQVIDEEPLKPLEVITTVEGVVYEGDLLDVHHGEALQPRLQDEAAVDDGQVSASDNPGHHEVTATGVQHSSSPGQIVMDEDKQSSDSPLEERSSDDYGNDDSVSQGSAMFIPTTISTSADHDLSASLQDHSEESIGEVVSVRLTPSSALTRLKSIVEG